MFFMFWKQTTLKILIYAVEARLHYSCFWAKISKSHNENDRPVIQLQEHNANTRKQLPQCMDTALLNMNGN